MSNCHQCQTDLAAAECEGQQRRMLRWTGQEAFMVTVSVELPGQTAFEMIYLKRGLELVGPVHWNAPDPQQRPTKFCDCLFYGPFWNYLNLGLTHLLMQ